MYGLIESPFKIEDWLKTAQGEPSPDHQVEIKRITQVPDQTRLTLTYQVSQRILTGLKKGFETALEGDFWAGNPPKIERVTIAKQLNGFCTIALEWVLTAPSVVYRAETAQLYVCQGIAKDNHTESESSPPTS